MQILFVLNYNDYITINTGGIHPKNHHITTRLKSVEQHHYARFQFVLDILR
jgi:hypothetical protein